MGYGYAAVELIKAWQARGIPVWAYERDAPVIFNMGQPHFYERVEGKLNIGYTPWESTGVPKAWPIYMNLMDEIWTPCEANKQWYEDAGVTVPIRVLPHGLNPDHWKTRMRLHENGEVFKFLHVGGDANRKGADIVYDAFKTVFGDSDKVHLTLKGRRLSFDVSNDSNVTHESELIPVEELLEMHYEHHAMIYPTRGEGFGFIPFQAAASGMPTAVTNWSGPVDYMEGCYPIIVDKLVEADYEPHEGMWAHPDFDDVCHWMDKFYYHFDDFRDEAYEKGRLLHEKWSWDIIADTALKYLSESLVRLHK